MAKWKSLNRVKVALYNSIREAGKRAERKGILFDLPEGSASILLDRSGGVCALSGLPFRPTEIKGQPGPYSASLDRIRPEGGYTLDNVRLILNGLNALKGTSTDEEVLEICRAVVEKNT